MLKDKRVTIQYQGKIATGTVIKSIPTETIGIEADVEKVLLHKVKLDKPIKVLWDDVEQFVSSILVDHSHVEVL